MIHKEKVLEIYPKAWFKLRNIIGGFAEVHSGEGNIIIQMRFEKYPENVEEFLWESAYLELQHIILQRLSK